MPRKVRPACSVTRNETAAALKKKWYVHAAMPDACSGNMPHVSQRQRPLPVAAAYCETAPIAKIHSKTDEKWIAHVASESACRIKCRESQGWCCL